MEFNKQRVARWSVALAAIVVAGVIPATAGNNGNGNGNGKDDTSTTDTTYHSGDINPTNVSIVSTDLALASVSYPVTSDQLSADLASQYATGRGVVVAVLDSGFDTGHPDIHANIVGSYDAIDGDHDVTDHGDGVDDDGDGVTDRGVSHGTFVAGMVLKAAPDAGILAIRVRNDEGRGTNETLKRGFRYAMESGAHVINLSLSDSDTMDKGFSRLLRYAQRAGISLVVSAGNDGVKWLNDIAYTPNTLAVGAVDAMDSVAEFSNYIDWQSSAPYMVFAPGVDVYGPMGADDHGWWSGTSFAAGTVSGAAALVRERHPDWSGSEVALAVANSLQPVWTHDGEQLDHSGRVDLLMVATK